MHALITINILDYFPSNFDFTGYNFIFVYEGKQIDKEISYIKNNSIFHKLFIPSKKDLKYSVRMLKNDSLIGLCDFIIPFSILHKKEKNYEKNCIISMTDSLKKFIFGSSTTNKEIKINIHSSLKYIGGSGTLREKSLRKNKSNVNKEITNTKILYSGKDKEPKSNRVLMNFNSELNNNSISIRKETNSNNSNRNNSKSYKLQIKNQYSNPFPHTQVVSPKKYLLYKIPGTELKKNSKVANININNINNLNRIKNDDEIEITELNINDDDPNDRSLIDKDLENEEKNEDKNLYEFINNLINENPLSELDNKKDIGEMIIYTKDIISQLLEYQIKFYDTLKKSFELNHKFKELLLKYNEQYRFVVKKMNKLNEEMNMHEIKKDIINNKNNNEKNDLNEIINLKNKELEIFKDIYKIQDEENINDINNEYNNDTQLKILLNAFQKISSKYGSLNELITKNNSTDNEVQNLNYILDKYRGELNINIDNNKNASNSINIKGETININDDKTNESKNENEDLEYILTDNPDDLDKLLNKNLKKIKKNKKLQNVLFRRIGKNIYEFGNKKVLVKRDDDKIKIRAGGIYISLDIFLETNTSTENVKKNYSQTKLNRLNKNK